MKIGWIASALTGAGIPSFVFIMADVIDSFNSDVSSEEIMAINRRSSLIFFGVGLVIWFLGYLSFTCLLIFSEQIAQKTRVKYLESILK